jgi:ribulose 1,5-bisphosphate synthetase/thiazole synthase
MEIRQRLSYVETSMEALNNLSRLMCASNFRTLRNLLEADIVIVLKGHRRMLGERYIGL